MTNRMSVLTSMYAVHYHSLCRVIELTLGWQRDFITTRDVVMTDFEPMVPGGNLRLAMFGSLGAT